MLDWAIHGYVPRVSYEHPPFDNLGRLQWDPEVCPLRDFKSFAPRKPPPLCLDRITLHTRTALGDLFSLCRDIRPPCYWVFVDPSCPDMRAVGQLHKTYLNLLEAMHAVQFAFATYFVAIRKRSTPDADAVMALHDIRAACHRVAECILEVMIRWDKTAVYLAKWLPLSSVERLPWSSDLNVIHRRKVLSEIDSWRISAQGEAAILNELYTDLGDHILDIDATRRAADIPLTNLNVALAALIWHEKGLDQYLRNVHGAQPWRFRLRGSQSSGRTTSDWIYYGLEKDEA
ncbi:hypothetical protein FB45DRAFT_999835 [Roridomyces roridus]|uniref:Uncharacterized protein n=1 Tax=Roridomyces roridus TaxID=1738132 RepID=A0AAD7FSF0_9AGAR|nr:hypothetical protein FB45DRAFT_999835 [Roridomyces roridus]